MATGRKTGGRRKGSLNKASAAIKASFQKHGDEFVEALLALTKSDDEHVRLKALQVCLDRAYGRPTQAVQVGVADERLCRAHRLDQRAAAQESPPGSRPSRARPPPFRTANITIR